ncbi:MAG: acyltransferase [Patescibacteria group bacterium]|nr:acyltransferase [Patescibacteria group bacterium]
MQINVANPQLQTDIFAILLFLTLILSARKFTKSSFFPVSVTDELKGLAILAVIFSHIGYFLSTNTSFLFPLSISAGVGVNLFLFLSGFGLTISSLKNKLPIINFYKKRLWRLYLPLWIVVTVLFILDKILLNINYSGNTIVQTYLGWFPHADLYRDADSPLWYFSAIVFYYLIFPFLFWRKWPYLSPLLVFLSGFLLLQFSLPVSGGVYGLYTLHTLAFPLGMLFAVVYNHYENSLNWGKTGWNKRVVKYPLLLFLILLFIYTSFNSGVGQGRVMEQGISIVTMLCAIFIFLIKDVRFLFLSFLGKYSYEIYLIHWPILYRYDILYKNLSAFLATYIYLGFFILLGVLLQKTSGKSFLVFLQNVPVEGDKAVLMVNDDTVTNSTSSGNADRARS